MIVEEDLLLPAYQKLYAALANLERFNKGRDLYDNITCIDTRVRDKKTSKKVGNLANILYLYG